MLTIARWVWIPMACSVSWKLCKRFFRRLIDDQELPERIVTDGLRSYGATLSQLPAHPGEQEDEQ